jgi:hypothetical protein
MFVNRLIVALAIGVFAAACTPTAGEPTTTIAAAPDRTTTTDGDTSDQPTTTTPAAEPVELEAPERGDPDDVASDAFWDAGDFRVADEPNLFDQDALTAIELWLPEDLVDGLVWEVFSKASNTNVLAVSVIPTLTWRGDPNFVPALIATLSDADVHEVSDGVFEVETTVGLVMYAWSTGDGFVISTSLSTDDAVSYLESLAAETNPQTVWDSQTCLYVDPDAETLPYAPFPPDIVVPCSGPHNAEVLVSEQIGTDLDTFDADTVEYDRNYRCDKAYTEAFGPQKDHTPTLITYMPDSDEWDRGDRYLACVVQLETIEGPLLIAGPMPERTDLDWNPIPEACLDRSFAPETVECGSPHGYQYLGNATVAFDDWPEDGASGFTVACDDLVDDFVRKGPVSVDVFATGLFPYAFEQGDRSVQCMAFAIDEGLLVDVVGSFGDVWRVIGSGGIAT